MDLAIPGFLKRMHFKGLSYKSRSRLKLFQKQRFFNVFSQQWAKSAYKKKSVIIIVSPAKQRQDICIAFPAAAAA